MNSIIYLRKSLKKVYETIDIGIPSDISALTIPLCNTQKAFMNGREVNELQYLLNLVQPYLDNVTSFKIILLLLLTESEYCPSFKRLHTAFASVILKNASGSDRPENEILGPYFQTLKRTKRIYQLIKDFIVQFHPH